MPGCQHNHLDETERAHLLSVVGSYLLFLCVLFLGTQAPSALPKYTRLADITATEHGDQHADGRHDSKQAAEVVIAGHSGDVDVTDSQSADIENPISCASKTAAGTAASNDVAQHSSDQQHLPLLEVNRQQLSCSNSLVPAQQATASGRDTAEPLLDKFLSSSSSSSSNVAESSSPHSTQENDCTNHHPAGMQRNAASDGQQCASSQHQDGCKGPHECRVKHHAPERHNGSTSLACRHSTGVDSPAMTPDAALPFWSGLQTLLSTPAVLIFMWQATVMGFGIGVIGEFLFLFLKQLGGNETVMGLSLTITCVSEVPAFHYQGAVLQRISLHTMIHIVLWTYAIRMCCYALLPYVGSPWAVLPIELLHGVTFACGWGAGTLYSKKVAPPGLEATMQVGHCALYSSQHGSAHTICRTVEKYITAHDKLSEDRRECVVCQVAITRSL